MLNLHLLVNALGLHRTINSCKLSSKSEIWNSKTLCVPESPALGSPPGRVVGTFSCLASELPAVHLPPVRESLKLLQTPKEKAIKIQISVNWGIFHRTTEFKMCVKDKFLKGRVEPKSWAVTHPVYQRVESCPRNFLPSHNKSNSAFFWSESHLKHLP